jgi:glycerol-3-phosphate acyltransferase PlsY
MFRWIFLILFSFVSGSILFCEWVPLRLRHKDITALSADHNPGASNVFTLCGVPMGILCLLLDLGKGFFPLRLACRLVDPKHLLFAAVIVAPVAGHALGLFNQGRGGKCIATSFGVLLGILSETEIVFLLAGVYILLSTVIKIPSHRTRSILTFGIFGCLSAALLLHQQQASLALGCVLLAATVIFKHYLAPEPTEDSAVAADTAEFSER